MAQNQEPNTGRKVVYDPSNKLFKIGLLTRLAQSQVQQFAEASADKAMYEGDFNKALAFLDVAFEAERRSVHTTDDRPSRHVKTPNRQYSVISAIFGRPDLIDHALAMLDLRIEDLQKPFTPTAPGTVFHGKTIDDATEYTPEMQIANHARSVEYGIRDDLERRQYTLDHRADIPRYRIIRESVAKNPGIRQIDLTKYLPGLENKRVARLVDQLEAAGFLVTGTVGSRVQVWPVNHPDAPDGTARRAPRWEFGHVSFDNEEKFLTSDAYEDPEATLRAAQSFAALVDAAEDDYDADSALGPTVLDFMDGHSITPSLTRGSVVHFDAERRSMAVWGHIEFDEALRILRHQLEFGENIERRVRTRWLSVTPRHTYLEREAHALTVWNGSIRHVFVLRETAGPSEHTVPVTAVSLPSKITVEDAARSGGVLWLAKGKAAKGPTVS